MNLHTPERQAHESQAEYRARQQRAKRHHQALTLSGPFGTHGGESQRKALRSSAFFKAGSYGKGLRNAITRKQKAALEAKRG